MTDPNEAQLEVLRELSRIEAEGEDSPKAEDLEAKLGWPRKKVLATLRILETRKEVTAMKFVSSDPEGAWWHIRLTEAGYRRLDDAQKPAVAPSVTYDYSQNTTIQGSRVTKAAIGTRGDAAGVRKEAACGE